MKFLEGLKEVLYNFTHQIEDNNAPTVEMSNDNFVALARSSGMSQENIVEMLKNRNGIELKKKRTSNVSKNSVIEQPDKTNKSKVLKRNEKGIER